jgi:CheY-like chemotaxis protein
MVLAAASQKSGPAHEMHISPVMSSLVAPVERVTVVVVDDDPDYLWLVRFILESGSDRTSIVGEAANGGEALALVLRERPDVVISDLMMPCINGLELTRRIKQERPQTKVILMSAYSEDTYRRIASASEADGFLNKHLIHSSLLPAIREVSPAALRR